MNFEKWMETGKIWGRGIVSYLRIFEFIKEGRKVRAMI